MKGKHVTGFTNGEEEEMKLTQVVPFLVEDELRLGRFSKGRRLGRFTLSTDFFRGQNPASSTGTAQALLDLLSMKKAA